MTDRDDRRDKRHRDPTEGVRLLGADEAAEALERDDIRHRLAEDQPRFGDRPAAPPSEGPRPALRFPLGSYDDPNSIERPPVVPVQRPTEAPELSHWAGSAAEEVPHMSGRDPRQGDDTWSGYDPDPRWREEPTRAPAPGPATLARPRPVRAAGARRPRRAGAVRGRGRPVSGAVGVRQPAVGRAAVVRTNPYADDGYGDEYEAGYAESYDDVYDDEVYDEPAAASPTPGGRAGPRSAPRRRRATRRAPDRDLRTAVLVGVGVPGRGAGCCSRCSGRSAA